MIVRYFNNRKPINLLFLSVVLNILTLVSFYIQGFKIISIENVSKINLILLSFFLFTFITRHKILSSKKDFGLLFYVLISGLLFQSFNDLHKIAANFLILFSLYQLYQMSNKEVNEKEKLFNTGFLIGLASLIYPLSIIYLLLSFVAVFIFNKINWRSFLIPIIGFIVPLFIAVVVKDLFGIILIKNLDWYLTLPFLFSSKLALTTIVLSFLLIWGLYKIMIKLNSELVFFKDYYLLMLINLVLSIVITFLDNNKDGSEMVFLIFPISIILANFITLIQKKWVVNIIIFILVGLMFYNYNI